MGYSSTVMEHFLSPRNAGEMENPDAEGIVGSPDSGQFMVIQLRVANGRVSAARFRTFGCGPAIAACSLLTEWAIGKSTAEIRKISAERLMEMLGGLPEDKMFCTGMAVSALTEALSRLP